MIDSDEIIDKIIDDFHEVNIVLNAINGHGKSSSLKTIIARLKEREPKSIIKIFDISQAWYHNAPVKYRQRITPENFIPVNFTNLGDCVYEIGSLTKDQRRFFISLIIGQDYQTRYEIGIKYGIKAIKEIPMIFYVFEEATNYFGSWSLKKNDVVAPILYDFITVGRNYGLRSLLVVTREIGSLSTDIRDISPKILGYIEAKSDLYFYRSKNKEVFELVKTMPKFHWVYCYRGFYGPFRIYDKVTSVPEDYVPKVNKKPVVTNPETKVNRIDVKVATIQPKSGTNWLAIAGVIAVFLILAWVFF